MRWIISLLLGALLVPLFACRPGRAPNIIIIMVDTLRSDYLGTYGFDGAVSPNVDALAEESIVFRNCFTQSPWTKPAVASLFTSLYPQVHGLTNHEGKYWSAESPELRTGILSARANTLAEALQEAGYATAGFVSNPWVTTAYGFSQGFDYYDERRAGLRTTVDDLVTDAVAWLDSRDPDVPYFLYLHFMDVHAPYDAPREDFEALRDSRDVQSDTTLVDSRLPDRRWSNIEVRPEWADDALRRRVSYWRTRYASGIRLFDRRIGGLLAWLQETGELDRSVVVFTSDHGEELHEHGDWSHGQNLFDHQLSVPLMIRNPGALGAGTEVESFVELVDLMPTLLSVAGVEPPDGVQGRDVSSVLRGSTVEDPAVTFATATQRRPGLYSVRTAGYKLIYDTEADTGTLFDLTADSGEQRDASATSPEIAADLRGRLLRHIGDSVAGGTLEAEDVAIPDDMKQRLEALGYVQ